MEWQNTEQRNTEQQIQNGKTRNNKSRIVKGGTSLVRYIAGYLDLNFNIFQCKSNRILVFTSVEGFSNILFKFLCIVYSSFKLLSVTYIHHLYLHMLYISYIINTFHALYITSINYKFFVSLQKSALCDAYFSIIIFHCKFPRDLFFLLVLSLLWILLNFPRINVYYFYSIFKR